MEDRQIIDLFLQRDERAIAETENKYGKYCGKIAINMLCDAEDVKEVLNDTYLGAWNAIPPHIPEILSSFLGKITRNLCLKKIRTKNTQKRRSSEIDLIFDEVSDFLCSGENVENNIEAKELSVFINNFLASRSAAEKRIFVCRYWYFDSIDDISKSFGFSVSKVKSILFRLRKKLYNELKKEHFI